MPKRSRSGEVSRPARVVAPTSVNGGRSSLIERAPGPSPIMMSSWKSSSAGIQHFLDDGTQAVDLVDEQHVARLEVREQRREIARPLEHRTRGLVQGHAELVRDDVRERGLAEAGRPEEQRVVERLAAAARGA